jgi:hypothetical protein
MAVLHASKVATFYHAAPPRTAAPSIPLATANRLAPDAADLALENISLEIGPSRLELLDFAPLSRADFLKAHTPQYVNAFFNGKPPLCGSNELEWSPARIAKVSYSNAGLIKAQEHSYLHPEQISLCPSADFFYATPSHGERSCTFSGQVLSALNLYRNHSASGAWINLDCAPTCSIESSRVLAPEMNRAVRPGLDINPSSSHETYLKSLGWSLRWIETLIRDQKISWLAINHGADSYFSDDQSEANTSKLTAKERQHCNQLVYRWIARIENKIQRPIPLTVCLYQDERQAPDCTITKARTHDIITCLDHLVGRKVSVLSDQPTSVTSTAQ